MTIQIDEYLRADGSNPYKAWFDGLEAQAAAKVTTAKLGLELGNTSSVKWFAGMGEYVINWGPGLRIYLVSRHSPNDGLHSSSTHIADDFAQLRHLSCDATLAQDGERLIVLFGGGTKRGQQRDIDTAKSLFAEYKARKKSATESAAQPDKRKR